MTEKYSLREAKKLPIDKRVFINTSQLLEHRKRIREEANRRQKWNEDAVSWRPEILEPDKSEFRKAFPNPEFNLWLFERGKSELEIVGIDSEYWPHNKVTYQTEESKREKAVLFKKTEHARFERFYAKLLRIVGNPSYKIQCVDDTNPKSGSWLAVQMRLKQIDDGEVISVEDQLPYLASRYAIIEWINGEGLHDFYGKVEALSEDEQQLLSYNLGKVAGFNHVFGGGADFKPEHIVVNPMSLECTRIDHEQNSIVFSSDTVEAMAREAWLDDFLLERHRQDYYHGAQDVIDMASRKWSQIENLVLRLSRFGVQGDGAVVSPMLLEQIKGQLDSDLYKP